MIPRAARQPRMIAALSIQKSAAEEYRAEGIWAYEIF